MKHKFFLLLSFFIFCFVVLFKGLNNQNIYTPERLIKKNLINFKSKNLFSNNEIYSNDILVDSKLYIINIWSSWCIPCRDEHSKLIKLSKNPSIKLFGLNYRDNDKNAKKFLEELGNPYSMVLVDKNGTISIELGAYGVPETFVINKNKKIIKKFIGPLNEKSLEDINLILK
tara:strand:+ start:77 stop:592 length:516 start_codon:yes stop_codon:yes gene_type:complete